MASPAAALAEAVGAPSKPTDPLAVYGALLPRAKVSTVPRARVPLVDTVLVAGGRVWKWLYTSPAGEVAERVHADPDTIQAAFLQSGETAVWCERKTVGPGEVVV
jgi:hypothetical protein